jgi:hypothetical protein
MITSSLLRVLMVSPLFNIDDFRLKSLNLTLTLLLFPWVADYHWWRARGSKITAQNTTEVQIAY